MKIQTITISGSVKRSRECSVTNCSRQRYSRFYCAMHQSRFDRHGDPEFITRASNGVPLKWLKDSLLTPTDKCVLWPYGLGNHGYGVVQFNGTIRTAHRVAMILYTGKDNQGMDVAHGPCHNRLCVNPLHLKWAERVENVGDMRRDGTALIGDKSLFMKIPDDEFLIIMNSGHTSRNHDYVQSLCSKYNVSSGYVCKILNKKARRCREFLKNK